MKLIVGLGNPGRAYAHTRHNVGFDVIDILSKRHHIRVSRRAAGVVIGQGQIAGDDVTLARPMTFMNLSGQAVAELAQRLDVHPGNVLIVYDDVNLPLGRIRIRLKGSAGGHNGMKSIIEKLHTQEFPRLRIGIGAKGNMVDHVLSRFRRVELAVVRPAMQDAADAVEMMLSEGIEPAMNRYTALKTMSDDIRDPESELIREEPVNEILEGHVWRAVWALSWPTMISMFLSTAYMWVNRYFVGQGLGTEAIDAVGLGGQALMIIFSLLSGITTGTTALVARFTGARTHEESVAAAKQSIIVSVLLSVVVTLPFIVFARSMVVLMGAKGHVVPMAVSYTIICVLSTLPFFVLLTLGAVFRGMGDMKTPLYITGLVTVVNIVGDYVLIFGIGPFPRMGVDGAALAVVISRIVGVLASLWWMLDSPLRDSLSRPWTPHWGWFVRISRIGIPAVVQGLMFSIGFTAFLWVLGKLSNATVAQAALFIGIGAESIAFMPGFGFMMAATSLVGQNLGARQPERAEHGAWICAWQCAAVMTMMAAIFYIFAEQFTRIFISDPQVIPLAVSYLRINAISEPFFGFGMVFTGAMQGAGDTKSPTIISFVFMWLIRIPLAYIWAVTLGGGTQAAWIVMAGTTILRGITMVGLFKMGKWKTVQV